MLMLVLPAAPVSPALVRALLDKHIQKLSIQLLDALALLDSWRRRQTTIEASH